MTPRASTGGMSAGIPDAETALIERCQQGDAAAFDALVQQYSSWVYNLAYRLTGNPDDAEDVAQEAFVRVFKAIRRYRRSAAFSTWLYRVVTNVCLDELKRRGRRPVPMSQSGDADSDPPEAADPMADPAEIAERRERQAVIQRAIASLPRQQRAVLVLCDVQGMSYEEAAEVLGAKVGTVKSRLNRARLALKARLEPVMELVRSG
jgi:RNA polymerase sigma-70 factor (ECF subfamily)